MQQNADPLTPLSEEYMFSSTQQKHKLRFWKLLDILGGIYVRQKENE